MQYRGILTIWVYNIIKKYTILLHTWVYNKKIYPYTPTYIHMYMHAHFPVNVYRVQSCYWPAKLISETLTESVHTVCNLHTAVLCIGMHSGYRQAVAQSTYATLVYNWYTLPFGNLMMNLMGWGWVTKPSCTHRTHYSIHSQQITRCR